MINRKAFVLLTTPLIGAALMLSAAPASAAVNNHTSARTPQAVEQAASPGYVIADTPAAVETDGGVENGGATFFPTGPVADDTLVVIPGSDGSLPNGLTQAKLDALAAQAKTDPTAVENLGLTVAGASTAAATATKAAPSVKAAGTSAAQPLTAQSAQGVNAYAATSAGWSQVFNGGSIIGVDETATVAYTFDVQLGTGQRNVAQGLGYYRGYNGSEFGVWEAWYNLGSADDNTEGGASVPWGNVAANTGLMAECATSTLCGGYWSP